MKAGTRCQVVAWNNQNPLLPLDSVATRILQQHFQNQMYQNVPNITRNPTMWGA